MAEDIRISELEPTTDLTGLYTIGTDKNNLSKKVSLQFLDDAANYANTQGDYAKASTDAIMDSTGLSQYSLFNTATNYMKNAVVRYNGKLYRFTRIHTAGAWLGTDVEETSLRNEILLVNLVNNLADGGVNADKVAADDRLAKYTGTISLIKSGDTYSGTILNLVKDDNGYLVIRFLHNDQLYKATHMGGLDWEVSKVTDLVEWESKLAQLSQEWQEIKDAEFNVIVEAIPHIEKIIVTDGGAVLQPDKLYDFGESAQIAVAFAPATEPKYAAQYAFQFKCPADAATTLTMPEGVVFPKESDSMLSLKAGLTYQITIVDNLAVATSWEV